VARVLIVGCGCRGRELGTALAGDGHAVRGTSRREGGLAEVEAAGFEGVTADPDRLATLMPQLSGTTVVCWLMGSASGPADAVGALHGPRLRSLQEKLVDSPARGLVYEAAGTVEPELLAAGTTLVRELGKTFHMPVEIVEEPPGNLEAWAAAMRAAVGALLA